MSPFGSRLAWIATSGHGCVGDQYPCVAALAGALVGNVGSGKACVEIGSFEPEFVLFGAGCVPHAANHTVSAAAVMIGVMLGFKG
jgi:hypothetical protein